MDYHRLELGTASSVVRSVRLVHWGAIVLVDCIYDPLGDPKAYELSFQGCSQIRIDMAPDPPTGKHEADLIGISLGQEGCRQPAILTTDVFELHVTYQQFECLKDCGASKPSGPIHPPARTGPGDIISERLGDCTGIRSLKDR